MLHGETNLERFLAQVDRRPARQYAALLELAFLAFSEPSVDGVLDAAVARVRDAFQCDYAKILDHRASASGILVRAGAGWPPGVVGKREVPEDDERSQGAFTLESGQPVIVADLDTEDRFRPAQLLREFGVRSSASVVIPGENGPLGVLEADSRSPHFFDDDDIDLLEAYALLISHAISQHERAELNAHFASVAAHELRTPLTSVVGFSRRLLDQLDREGSVGADRREELAFVYDGAVQLQRSVRLVLALGELDRRELHLERTQIDVVEEIRSAIEVVAQLHPTTRFTIDVDGDTAAIASTDPVHLAHIFGNLIENAAKYSPPGSEVRIGVSRSGDDQLIEIADACGGMAADDLRHLFERSFRGDGAARGGNGLGIGLYIALRLAERIGASISADNHPPEGCVFSVRLPVDLSQASATSQP